MGLAGRGHCRLPRGASGRGAELGVGRDIPSLASTLLMTEFKTFSQFCSLRGTSDACGRPLVDAFTIQCSTTEL
jgi:hypothetical protein